MVRPWPRETITFQDLEIGCNKTLCLYGKIYEKVYVSFHLADYDFDTETSILGKFFFNVDLFYRK